MRAHAARLLVVNRRESSLRFAAKQFFGMRWRGLGAATTAPVQEH